MPHPDPTPPRREVTGDPAAFDLKDYIEGPAAFLGGMANVVMQLSRPEVAYGVYESPVDTGRIDRHPLKRLRTTLTYLGVATLGTEAERDAYRVAVDQVHRQVRSTQESPVSYHAMNPRLQLWVAACLYIGWTDTWQRMHGPLDAATADAVYRHAARLATSLQVRPEMWPVDRAAFEVYWQTELATVKVDATIQQFLDGLIDLTMLPISVRLLFARVHRFIVTGMLPPPIREQLGMTWSDRQQRRFDRLLRAVGRVLECMPGAVRRFPVNIYLWDLRRRLRTGRPLV
ncbi:oxygenase MpaB family protein [Nocardia sp. NPDC050406]|uniref:oxygenase MpaB family protein n=1 Tax=Nocardia sp. NPDC050406 TaxID=3364318 RepID=UPI0037BBC051